MKRAHEKKSNVTEKQTDRERERFISIETHTKLRRQDADPARFGHREKPASPASSGPNAKSGREINPLICSAPKPRRAWERDTGDEKEKAGRQIEEPTGEASSSSFSLISSSPSSAPSWTWESPIVIPSAVLAPP